MLRCASKTGGTERLVGAGRCGGEQTLDAQHKDGLGRQGPGQTGSAWNVGWTQDRVLRQAWDWAFIGRVSKAHGQQHGGGKLVAWSLRGWAPWQSRNSFRHLSCALASQVAVRANALLLDLADEQRI